MSRTPKSKSPALNRILRQENARQISIEGEWLPTLAYGREELRKLIRQVAAECAKIADAQAGKIETFGQTGAPAVEYTAKQIREAFGLEEK